MSTQSSTQSHHQAEYEEAERGLGYFFAELLEAAIKLALSHDPEARRALGAFAGHTLKIKCVDPHIVFYVHIDLDGVRLSDTHQGIVHARVKLPTALLVRHCIGLGEGATDFSSVKTSGDEALLGSLAALIMRFNLLNVCKELIGTWLPEFGSVDELLAMMRAGDADWLQRLEHLPQLINQNIEMTRKQAELLEQQHQQLLAIQRQLDTRSSHRWVAIPGLLIAAAWVWCEASGGTVLGLPGATLERALLVVLALAVLMRSGR